MDDTRSALFGTVVFFIVVTAEAEMKYAGHVFNGISSFFTYFSCEWSLPALLTKSS